MSGEKHGAISSPVFSPDGKQLAWLEMSIDGFEADRRQIVVQGISGGKKSGEQHLVLPKWDRSPSKLEFSEDGKKLLAVTEDEEHVKVFEVDIADSKAEEPSVLIDEVGVSEVQVLPNGRVANHIVQP